MKMMEKDGMILKMKEIRLMLMILHGKSERAQLKSLTQSVYHAQDSSENTGSNTLIFSRIDSLSVMTMSNAISCQLSKT